MTNNVQIHLLNLETEVIEMSIDQASEKIVRKILDLEG